MPVAYATYIDGTNSSGSTTGVIDFTGRSVGDLALVILSTYQSPDGGNTDPSAEPSGWTKLQSVVGLGEAGHWLYYKILAAGDIGNVTWTWAVSKRTLAHAVVYTGHDTTTPIAQSAKYEPGDGGSTLNFGSLTSTNAWLVQLGGGYHTSARSFTPADGYTERRDDGSTTADLWHIIADTNGTWVSGASDPAFTVNDAIFIRGGFQVDIAPASGPAAPVLSASQSGSDIEVTWS